MKSLYMIGGTMGVGKTAVSQCLKAQLSRAVFLDGDWCWDADPFQVTAETRDMVMDNICHLLNNFLHCSAYENIIFCWVMHEQDIIDTILARIDTAQCRVKTITLTASAATLRERILRDVDCGRRSADVLERSLVRIPLYEALNTVKIQTDGKSVREIAGEIRG